MSRVSRLMQDLRANQNSVEGLNRLFRPQTIEAPAIVPVEAIDATTLPVTQQAALLFMHVTHVKQALIRHLLEDSQDGVSRIDFRELVVLQLCRYSAGKRQHDLTELGVATVKAMVRKLCLKFDVHLMTEGGRVGHGEVSFACPCGFRTQVRASNTAWGNANTQHATFIRTQMGMQKLAVAMKPANFQSQQS